MDISIRGISYETAGNIEATAASSLFWQIPHDDLHAEAIADPEFEKELWLQRVLMEWGICGYTAFVSTGDQGSTPLPAATIIFAPASYLPGAAALPSGPVSPDAILITSVHVALPYMGLYLEHQLIDIVLEEARRRGIKAVEAFARVDDLDDELTSRLLDKHMGFITDNIANYVPEAYRGWEAPKESEADEDTDVQLDHAPMLSEDILEEQGFTVVKHHPKFPRYRKEIKLGNNLFSRVEADEHEDVNGARQLGTVIGGGRRQRAQPTFLRAGDNKLFRR